MNRPAGVSALLALGVLLALLAGAIALRIPPAPDPFPPGRSGAASRQAAAPEAAATRTAPAEPQGTPSALPTPEPAARTKAATAATVASATPSTTIVVLRWSAERVELVRAVDKPGLPFAGAEATGPARWVLEDPASGARLGEGACSTPRLCECERGADHRRGDVLVRHEAVVRLKLPRLLPRQRLRIEAPGPTGWETLGAFLVEDRS